MLDLIFLNSGRGKEALGNYKTALQLNPNHTVALVNMARHLRGAGNIQEAEQAYKRFVLRCRTLCVTAAITTTTATTTTAKFLYPGVEREEFTILYQSKNDRGTGYLK